jgi:N-acetylglucosamine-6-sulfatase
VPLLGVCPEVWPAGSTLESVVANIDIGPTILEAAGLKTPDDMDGRSFYQLAAGKMDPKDWRQYLLYEYYWEFSFPQTPTTFALRGPRYKFIQYHGIWDIDELYDLQTDPLEQHNLIFEPGQQKRIAQMRTELHQLLESAHANRVPFSKKRSMGQNLRLKSGAEPGDFPQPMIREKGRE